MTIGASSGVGFSMQDYYKESLEKAREKERQERSEELSTGKKINDAADNPATMAIATQMVANYIGLNAETTNIESEMSRSNVADGALSDSQATLSRMQELTMQAQNGILTDTDRSYIQAEMDELSKHLGSISGNTEFNTKEVFDGEGMDLNEETLGSFKVDVNDPDALSKIQGMSAAVSQLQAEEGAEYNGLESQASVNQTAADNMLTSASQMQDTNYAESTSALIKNNLLDQYRMQMQGQMQTQMMTQMSNLLMI
ncbi:hypothetical protein AN641_08760 [Candidatus Epulonipiscioides gigas]|nr:hypothetical protein AN641_08760 [Epulopiscium sp. SCG-C07WGA-EpuloA2]